MYRKGLAFAIVVLFVGASIIPITGLKIENHISTNDKASSEKNNRHSLNEQSGQSEDWWDYNWTYRKKITINHELVIEDLQNFPILISNISSDYIVHAQSDGDDFVFVSDDNTTKYNHEIENYDSSSGELIAWINITYLSSTVDTVFYLYYGNPTCSNQQNIHDTWDSNYDMVQHMKDVTQNEIYDSTSHHINGIKAAPNQPEQVIAKIGNGQDFDAGSEDIHFGDNCDQTGAFTLEAWIKHPDSNGEDRAIIFKYGAPSTAIGYTLGLTQNGNTIILALAGNLEGVYSLQSTDTYDDNVWHHVVGVRSGDGRLYLYNDGSLTGPVTLSYPGDQSFSTELYVGNFQLHGQDFIGIVDEVRISHTARSTAWIQTSCQNQDNPISFMMIGEESIYSSNQPPVANFTYKIDKLSVDFNASSSFDPDGNITNCIWDFGDGTTGIGEIVTHNYLTSGTFNVTLKVVDDGGCNDSITKTIEIEANHKPEAPIINGPISGHTGNSYPYAFVSEDPDDDDVYYQIMWGDGIIEDWFGPNESNEIITKFHTYYEKGNYTIMARAKDIYDAIGEWGTLQVNMPKIKTLTNTLFLKILEIFPNAFPKLRYILEL